MAERKRRQRSDKGTKRGPRAVPDKLTRAVSAATVVADVPSDCLTDTTERPGVPVVVAPEYNGALIWRACKRLNISPDAIKKYEVMGDKITVVTHEQAHTLLRSEL